MDIYEAIRKRRSIRKFQDRPVSNEKVKKILEAAILAPSAGNIEEWRFIIVENSNLKSQISKAALGQEFIAQAPVVIVLCADLKEIEMAYGNRGVEVYSLLDCGMVAQNLMLAATADGLSTCPVGAFEEKEIKEILNLPDNLRPFLIIPLGYPAESPPKRPRKGLKELIVRQ